MTKPKKTKDKPGPKPKEIQPDKIMEYASVGATWEEIASRLDVSVRTLRRRRKDDPALDRAYKRGMDGLRVSLRAEQVKVARAPRKKKTYTLKDGTTVDEIGDFPSGKNTMLVWLGKQLLGQRDNAEMTVHSSTHLEDLSTLSNRDLEERLAILGKLAESEDDSDDRDE